MKAINDSQIEELLEEISSIKSVIKKNRKLVQQLLLPGHFRLMSFIAGISVIVFSLLFYFLIDHYASLRQIPGAILRPIIGFLIAEWIFLGILKYTNWLRSLIKIDQKYTLSRALKEFFSYRIIHIWVPLFFLMIFLSIYFGTHNRAYYIVPILSIGVGLIYNLIGSIAEIRQYLITGYWLLVTGICALIFDSFSPLMVLSVSIGCGLLLFALPIKED